LQYSCLLIGFGQHAIDDYLPVFFSDVLPISLIGICDLDKDKENLVNNVFGQQGLNAPRFFCDYKQACELLKPDFVIVSTPHGTHFEISKYLLENKIPFLKEKPFAFDLKDALFLEELIRKHKGYMRTCVQRRSHPLYMHGQKSLFHLKNLRRFEARYQLNATAYCNGWRASLTESGGGCVIDMGYHYLDLLYWYFGLPSEIHTVLAPKKVGGVQIEETVLTTFKYPNGMVGTLFLSLCESKKMEEFKIFGSAGHIKLERELLERFDEKRNLVESLTRTPAWPVALTDVVFEFLKDFGKHEIALSECDSGVGIMKMIDGIYKSIQDHQVVNLFEGEDYAKTTISDKGRYSVI